MLEIIFFFTAAGCNDDGIIVSRPVVGASEEARGERGDVQEGC